MSRPQRTAGDPACKTGDPTTNLPPQHRLNFVHGSIESRVITPSLWIDELCIRTKATFQWHRSANIVCNFSDPPLSAPINSKPRAIATRSGLSARLPTRNVTPGAITRPTRRVLQGPSTSLHPSLTAKEQRVKQDRRSAAPLTMRYYVKEPKQSRAVDNRRIFTFQFATAASVVLARNRCSLRPSHQRFATEILKFRHCTYLEDAMGYTEIDLQFPFFSKMKADQDHARKDLFTLPLEIVRSIFAYLPMDMSLAVEAVQVEGSPRSRLEVAALNPIFWRAMLSNFLVSKKFRSHLLDAIEWAGRQRQTQIRVHITATKLFPLSPHDHRVADFSSGYPWRRSGQVPPRILRQFRSIELVLPIEVQSSAGLPVDSEIRALRATIDQSGDGKNYIVTKTRWSLFKAASNAHSAILFADTFEGILSTFYNLDASPHAWSWTNIPDADSFKTVIHGLILHAGAWTIDQNANGTGWHVISTRISVDSCVAALIKQSRGELIFKGHRKLGWRGSPPAAGVAHPSSDDDASILTKWKPCAELINARRWEEPKVIKLGWRGCPRAADARRRQEDLDTKATSKAMQWINGLGV